MSLLIRSLLAVCCLLLVEACTGTSSADERPPDGGALRLAQNDLGTEALLQMMLATLPRFGANREYLVYEEDLVMTEAELRAHIHRMSQLTDSARRDLAVQRATRCIKCYDVTICDPELRQALQSVPDYSPTKLCAQRLRSKVAGQGFEPEEPTERFRQIRKVLKDSAVDVRAIDRAPERAKNRSRLRTDSDQPSRAIDDEVRPIKKPRTGPRGEVSVDDVSDPDISNYVRIGKKYYTGQTILGVFNLVPDTCKISTWVKQSEVAAAKVTPAELTYVIDQASFEGAYSSVRNTMHTVTQRWSDLCGDCLFKFAHREELDGKANLTAGRDAVFVVRREKAGPDQANFLALSFFPNDAPDRRYLRLFQLAGRTYPLDALLLHELGHILGLRHEHLRQQAGCIINALRPSALENPYWVPFTRFDQMSIMHYACGPSPFNRINFSSGDGESIRALYQIGDLQIDQNTIRTELEREPGTSQTWAKCDQFIRDTPIADIFRGKVREATSFR